MAPCGGDSENGTAFCQAVGCEAVLGHQRLEDNIRQTGHDQLTCNFGDKPRDGMRPTMMAEMFRDRCGDRDACLNKLHELKGRNLCSRHLGCKCCTEVVQSSTASVVINAMLPRRRCLKTREKKKRALLPTLNGRPPGYTIPFEIRWQDDRSLITKV